MPSTQAHSEERAPRIAMLTAGGTLSTITVNSLARRFGAASIAVVEEEPEPKAVFLRRRLAKLGLIEVAGQLAFAVAQKIAARSSAARIAQICALAGLDDSTDPAIAVCRVPSVNSHECRTALAAIEPTVVIVHGTRIIRRDTLRAVSAPFINFHAGINPKYRGQHGGYWARAERDHSNVGVTIHLIDEGVDTGGVLYQAPFAATARDNINTYQYLQTAVAQPLLIQAAEDALAGRLRPRTVDLPSRQWFHPTLWSYLRTGLAHGIW